MIAYCQIIVVVVFVGIAATTPAPQGDVSISSYTNTRPSPNAYKFSYILSDGTFRLERGDLLNPDSDHPTLSIVGEYSWNGPDGKKYSVTYTADENGYKPTIAEGVGSARIPPVSLRSLIG